MKPPNRSKCTIGEWLTFCANNNGNVSPKLQVEVERTLSRASFLDNVRDFPYSAIRWADRAWNYIQQIGVTDSLELCSSKPVPEIPVRFEQLERACKWLQLYLNKVNGRIVITRKPYSKAVKTTCKADQ